MTLTFNPGGHMALIAPFPAGGGITMVFYIFSTDESVANHITS